MGFSAMFAKDGLLPVALVGAAALAGASGVALGQDALASQEASSDGGAAAAVQTADDAAAAPSRVTTAEVQGDFAFTQAEVTPLDQIARGLGGANRVLCGASSGAVVAGEAAPVREAGSWPITVDGNGVRTAFTATLGDLAKAGSQTTLMGCSCLGNPADGRASVNAECTGVGLSAIFDAAGLLPEANTVTFVCADGKEVALPLAYVRQRASMIVYRVNGEPLDQSVGGTNQLWLGSTAARYFASDVVEVRVTCEDEAPAAPGSPAARDAAPNLPNVSVLEGASAQGFLKMP